MITLNNGQKPMSARHQIEILADSFFDFQDINLKLVAEKGRNRVRAPDSFRKGDFVKGYMAYLSNSTNIDNQKIIEEKMDELIASKILESEITTQRIEFADIVELINKLSDFSSLKEWIRIQNNFIGFCVGIRNSLNFVKSLSAPAVENAINKFEKAFLAINLSKVKVGKVRREMVAYYIHNLSDLIDLSDNALLDKIADQV